MRVAVVLDQYYKEDGGAFTFQGEVLSALVANIGQTKHEFVVFSPIPLDFQQGTKLSWRLYRRPGVFERLLLKLFRYLPSLSDAAGWQSSLERQVRRESVQFAWFLSPRLREMRLPFMPIVLDLQHRLQPQFPEVSARGEWRVREQHYRRGLPRASAIIAGTNTGREEIVRFYKIPAERVIVLPHPTPLAALASNPSWDLQILDQFGLKPGFLLYPAQFWTHKNHVNLLKALGILREQRIVLQLVLTGADFGAEKKVRREITRLGLKEHVKLLGFVAQEELYVLYRNALALTYVSFFGPENLPPLEAFALGCPVIAANVSGAEEQMGSAAILVNPAEPSEIAAAVRKVHEDAHMREQLRQAGRTRAAAWTSDDFVRGVFAFLDEFESKMLVEDR